MQVRDQYLANLILIYTIMCNIARNLPDWIGYFIERGNAPCDERVH
jgi:hypothetical protein